MNETTITERRRSEKTERQEKKRKTGKEKTKVKKGKGKQNTTKQKGKRKKGNPCGTESQKGRGGGKPEGKTIVEKLTTNADV
jgi:hypothetical protein